MLPLVASKPSKRLSRFAFDSSKASFASLIDRAKDEGLIDDYAHDMLHTGRKLRNIHIHETSPSVYNPASAAQVIATSHKLVAEIFDDNDVSGK